MNGTCECNHGFVGNGFTCSRKLKLPFSYFVLLNFSVSVYFFFFGINGKLIPSSLIPAVTDISFSNSYFTSLNSAVEEILRWPPCVIAEH